MSKIRADRLLVLRGLAPTRAAAQAAIEAGLVRAAGAPVMKAAAMLPDDIPLEAQAPHPWVSRGGVKLAHALDVFGVEPQGRLCLDLGASTGGFSEVLLARGAAAVTAVDVGHGQLHPKLRADPRLTALEGQDARTLTRAQVAAGTDLIVADVSFIGLAKALPAALSLAAATLDLVALIKPQFEAGPGHHAKRDGKGNLEKEAARSVAEQAAAGLQGLGGVRLLGLIESPILGGAGAPEWLAHAVRL